MLCLWHHGRECCSRLPFPRLISFTRAGSMLDIALPWIPSSGICRLKRRQGKSWGPAWSRQWPILTSLMLCGFWGFWGGGQQCDIACGCRPNSVRVDVTASPARVSLGAGRRLPLPVCPKPPRPSLAQIIKKQLHGVLCGGGGIARGTRVCLCMCMPGYVCCAPCAVRHDGQR